jgi:ParB family chromosome partitioning protein
VSTRIGAVSVQSHCEVSMSSIQILQIPIDAITWPEQERKSFPEDGIAELGETIQNHGILAPIVVRRKGDRYEGICGQRRWLGGKRIGLKDVPAIVHDNIKSEAEVVEIRLIENTARQHLAPLEQADGLAHLMEIANLSASDAAKRVGMNPAAVTKALSLRQLPDWIREKISAGVISAGAGYELARIKDPEVQAELAKQVASGALSRDRLVAMVKARKRGAKKARPSGARVTATLDSNRSITLSGNGMDSVEVLIQWLEELLIKARKARPQNLALATFLHILRDQVGAGSANS